MTSCDVIAPQSSNVLLLLINSEVLVTKTSEECRTADGGRSTPNESNLAEEEEEEEEEIEVDEPEEKSEEK